MSFSVLSDAPAKRDLLNFNRYSEPLTSVLINPALETPFTISIFGSWGSGKSTLLHIIKRNLSKKNGNRFLFVEFNPWVYRREPNMLIPLLNCLHDALANNKITRIQQSADKIVDVLLHLGADLFLKSVSAGTIDLEKLEKLEKTYLNRRMQLDSQMRNLRLALAELAKTLGEEGTRIVFLIDDLDRCDPTEIIDVLESMKLFLDLENVVHILALDKEVIDRGIEVKYGKFAFGAGRSAVLGSEYLEKMIQMPVYLFPLHPEQVRGYIESIDASSCIGEYLELLVSSLSPNPRKIKRALNMLALTNQILDSSPDKYGKFDRFVTTALTILRIEEPELYLNAAVLPTLLPVLEDVYLEERSVSNADNFIDFGMDKTTIQAICEKYYRPSSYLAHIFKNPDRNFRLNAGQLKNHFSVVGGF
ncbi:KAP family P-loop NTPase fold protein [Methylomonas sp. 2BW1-5-20]|uniref:KAP family P-loop NTPase fold protein n=1 Tax=Methylomonas sp. 2BW1-5-20 TaxID=3376686 RepID=UPI00405187AB